MSYEINEVVDGLNSAMVNLRHSVSGMPFRWSRLSSDHAELTRALADLSTMVMDGANWFDIDKAAERAVNKVKRDRTRNKL